MHRLGLLDSPELRLPLVPVDEKQASILDPMLVRAGLLQLADAQSR